MKKVIISCVLLSILTGCVGRTVRYDNQEKPVRQENPVITKKEIPVIQPKSYGIYDRYKNFILKINPKISSFTAVTIANIVEIYSREHSLDSKLVLALISRESSFRADAVSKSGAIGLGQLLKQTAKDMGINNPYNTEENIKATTKYLALLVKKWNGNVNLALASYKMGHGNVTKILKKGEDLPLPTKKYIKEIMIAQSKI